MKDCNGKEIHQDELVIILNHPEETFQNSWMVLDCLGCANNAFVLQHYITHEIKIFPQADVQREF